MLTKLIVILLWLTALTFWVMITQERREDKVLSKIEADVFGEEKV